MTYNIFHKSIFLLPHSTSNHFIALLWLQNGMPSLQLFQRYTFVYIAQLYAYRSVLQQLLLLHGKMELMGDLHGIKMECMKCTQSNLCLPLTFCQSVK